MLTNGEYLGFLSGHVVHFFIHPNMLIAEFEPGEQGFNIRDTITVEDGKVYSMVLKAYAKEVNKVSYTLHTEDPSLYERIK